MKKRVAIFACALSALFTMQLLSGCDFSSDKESGNTTPPQHGSDPPQITETYLDAFWSAELSESDVLVKADGGAVYIRWAAQEGALGYTLYRAESTFGFFSKVADLDADVLSYETDTFPYDVYKVCVLTEDGEREIGASSTFSPNAYLFSPYDDAEAAQSAIDAVHSSLETGSTGQFSSRRAALMFLPGSHNLTAKVGYYTSVNGLGEVPTDVSLKEVYVSDKVLSDRNATCTFWRSVENVSVRSSVTWAVSQATSFRRSQIRGSLSLSYGGWASGGFIANCEVTDRISAGTQQQWYTRNTVASGYIGGSFNMVYSGCIGETGSSVWTADGGSVTNLDTTEKVAEKPFLYQSGTGYQVFVPLVRENTRGITWGETLGQELGVPYGLDEFYIADARYDTADSINEALEAGRHLLLTPGIYELDKPIEVTWENTVILGLGYATLKIGNGNQDAALKVADVPGVRVADILVDAGGYSKNMVVIGEEGSEKDNSENPVVLSDLYFRIGGVENVHTETDTALLIYANDVIGDNFWVWRADHSNGVAWNDENAGDHTNFGNPAKTGVEVQGDRVRCYALMVEHFEEYQTLWKGEDGLTVMYQSETPYLVPDQSAWMSHDGAKRGYASYKVDDAVTRHRAVGIGVYLVNPTGMTLDSAIEVPVREGILMEHLITCNFSGNKGRIENVINDYGGAVGNNAAGQRRVPKFPL